MLIFFKTSVMSVRGSSIDGGVVCAVRGPGTSGNLATDVVGGWEVLRLAAGILWKGPAWWPGLKAASLAKAVTSTKSSSPGA